MITSSYDRIIVSRFSRFFHEDMEYAGSPMCQAVFTTSPERCCTPKLKIYSDIRDVSVCGWPVRFTQCSYFGSQPQSLTLQPKWLGVHTQEDASTSLPFNCKKTPNYVNKFPNYHLLTVLCLSYASPCLQMSSICGIAGSRQCWILHCVLSMQLLTALAQGKLMPSVTQSLPFLSLNVAEEKYLTPGF